MNQEQLFEQLKNYDVIIFDLDETLYSQEDFDKGAFFDAFAELCTDIPADRFVRQLVSYKKVKGAEYRKLFNDALSWLEQPIEIHLQACIERYRKHDGRYLQSENSLAPLLAKLNAKQKKLFLVTNGWPEIQNTKIDKLGLRCFFHEIYICQPGNNVLPAKPDPKVLSYLPLGESVRCVMVGDNPETDGKFAENGRVDFLFYQYVNKSID